MKKMSLLFSSICLCLLSATVSFASGTIKIGALFAVTGPASFLGEPEKKTLELLVKEANEKGGINGRSWKPLFMTPAAMPPKLCSWQQN